ncbi:MAG: hypothetical protein U5O16_23510 [Rhodococcus sp. (in: high G+C Gram-positive bacteria)]|uniref:hypothetical protein n=1 Tax=Rhodococcus sp. TaxID=1831 RepID=UPI002ADCC840|nr:hypothetical protein [Rhodococcus sp. (in: high G+C Gram-positive bacteria)]
MTADPVYCLGCNSIRGYGNTIPTPSTCSECPPTLCPDCGEWDGHQPGTFCRCWVSMDNDSPADIKAMFADIGLSVTTTKVEPT